MHDPMIFILEESLEAIEKGVLTRTQCLERYPEYRNELAALLDAALILRSAKIPAPGPAHFRAGKARLIAQIKQEQQVTVFDRWSNFVRAITPTSLKRQAVSLVLLVTLVFVMLGGGTVYASAHALPGDALYPVKTAVEDLRLVVAGDERDSELHIQFTATRVEEIQALIEAGRDKDLPKALQRFEENLLSASHMLENPKPGDEGWAEEKAVHLEEQMDQHIVVLNQVIENAPEAAKPGLERAIAVTGMKRERLNEQWRGEESRGSGEGDEPAVTPTSKPSGIAKPTDLPSGRPEGTGKPTDTPGGKPDETGKPTDTPGGKPDETGKPTDTPGGKPDETGKPTDTPGGKPDETGKPTDTPGGKPDDIGKPTDTPGGKPDDIGKPPDTPGDVPEDKDEEIEDEEIEDKEEEDKEEDKDDD
jgi:hypothetical protein